MMRKTLRIQVRHDPDGWYAVRNLDTCKVIFRCLNPEDEAKRTIIEVKHGPRRVWIGLADLPELAAAGIVLGE